MIKPPRLENIDLTGKKVVVRADLDVGDDLAETDVEKLKTIIPTINYLLEKNNSIILIGHRGRPELNGLPFSDYRNTDERKKLSLRPVAEKLSELINRQIKFVADIAGDGAKEMARNLNNGEILMLENLRFDPREEGNDHEFVLALASMGEAYINEAFSASHRNHASIVGLPKILLHAAGVHFSSEIENLSRILNNPKNPVIFIISGLKEDKLSFISDFEKMADKILIGGRLPEYHETLERLKSDKLIVARLLPDKEDITIHSIENFEKEIEKAGTIVLSGPIGMFEDEGHRMGTKRILDAITNNVDAFKVAGGGDTEQAIKLFGLTDKFDWVSVGGGASLEFLAKGTLAGIDALTN